LGSAALEGVRTSYAPSADLENNFFIIGKGLLVMAQRWKKNSTAVMRLTFRQDPAEYIYVGEDRMGNGVWGDHVSKEETSVRILALMAICVSVSVTSYLSDGRKDIQSCILALKLGLECSEGEIS